MSNDVKPWPLYSAPQYSRALKIKALSEPVANDINIKIVTVSFVEDFRDMELLPAFMDQFKPVVGGYIVQHLLGDDSVATTEYMAEELFNMVFKQCDEEGKTIAECTMPVTQEPKFGIRNGALYVRATGEAIPFDEPVFIYRAKDINASAFMASYAAGCTNPKHIDAVMARVADFERFREEHPERMKQPDTQVAEGLAIGNDAILANGNMSFSGKLIFNDDVSTFKPITQEVFSGDRGEAIRNKWIAHLLGKIHFYGGFQVETHNEAMLDKLMSEGGYRYVTEAAIQRAEDQLNAQSQLMSTSLEELLPWTSKGPSLSTIKDPGTLRGLVINLWWIIQQIDNYDGAKDQAILNFIKERSLYLTSDGRELFIVQK